MNLCELEFEQMKSATIELAIFRVDNSTCTCTYCPPTCQRSNTVARDLGCPLA
eukprot:SAG22_NODE_6699_length_821_cov_77.174515_2_plen_52_part_01